MAADFAGTERILARVQRPGRYAGGEYGSVVKEGDGLLRVAVSYPDLYEIGMCNAAVRIIYRDLNRLDGVACERVFAPAPDLEAVLRDEGASLFSLETRRPLRSFDLIAFSIGFELTLTNLLAILDLGGVPLRAAERGESDPIVIAGGPAVSNPAPLGAFLDGVFIGEAEGWLTGMFTRLARMKRSGARREALRETLRGDSSIWFAGRTEPVRRAFWRGFGNAAETAAFPVPSMRVVQDHGTVEIMRGCPNACRFCHAASYYRPCRRKDPASIRQEASDLVRLAGYREITLSSLSSGDYPGIHGLVRGLNAAWAAEKVSFSLPSLRVDSLALGLLAEVAEVRKSGLTFAVETPRPEWQLDVRKQVPVDKVIAILREAKARGWKAAKFYFMVGLPPASGEDEAGPIVDFLREVRSATGMTLNVNVASFIPKPHTPYERAVQLGEQDALEAIQRVRNSLHGFGFKIGYHAPLLSLLEGLVSRGDERAGELVLAAYRRGARLDAWEEYLQADTWRSVIAEAPWDAAAETCRPRTSEERLPWADIALALSRSAVYEPAAEQADREVEHTRIVPAGIVDAPAGEPSRVLFRFAKRGRAVWISHLDLMSAFERSLVRAGYRAKFTEGFNPKPRLEFASPLALGAESTAEIASVELEAYDGAGGFAERMNRALPPGISVEEAAPMPAVPRGCRRPSLGSAYWGSEYRLSPDRIVLLPKDGPGLKTLRSESEGPVRIERLRTLAAGPGGEPVSYFEAFRSSSLS
ncbi:MAG: TIGR03936 family radical SAM-associated protein [Spirochaetes bacterium]|nr:TIGR03936 family radical SAM-associated protein [Spirochaetota bacterium]